MTTRTWDSLSERDRVMIVRETKNYLSQIVGMMNQTPLSAVGAQIEVLQPELAALFKEAGAFGDRVALQLQKLDTNSHPSEDIRPCELCGVHAARDEDSVTCSDKCETKLAKRLGRELRD